MGRGKGYTITTFLAEVVEGCCLGVSIRHNPVGPVGGVLVVLVGVDDDGVVLGRPPRITRVFGGQSTTVAIVVWRGWQLSESTPTPLE